MARITKHMILPAKQVQAKRKIHFFFGSRKLEGLEGEVISSALLANGIKVFGLHHKDRSPQGIFCANGQCAQCNVLANGIPVKSCITPVEAGMKVEEIKGLPGITGAGQEPLEFGNVKELEPDVLIIGGGPAGLTAAIELGMANASVLVVDDKHCLGGKLVLQTHKFFGSVEDCYAGTRGINIAQKLEDELARYPCVTVWLNSVAVGVFSDKKIGVLKGPGAQEYRLVKPRAVLVAAGAREKSIPFEGNTLPGVYGAGAFQTIVNRDMVKSSDRLFIMGGGNVGLITGYHALQAGIDVAGLAEALPQVSGYKVHSDKLKRLGVPIYTSHTVTGVYGKGKVESVTIAEVDKDFKPVKNTAKSFHVDALLVAVGLNPVDELYLQAENFGMNVFAAGDTQEISEASAAIFSGKIAGRRIARNLGISTFEIPPVWSEKFEILKGKPGKTSAAAPLSPSGGGIFPVFHCVQEIPCDPCVSICPKKAIKLKTESIMSLPYFEGECMGCAKCVTICPGLAVTLVDCRKDENFPTVTIPFEIGRDMIKKGDFVKVTDIGGKELAMTEVTDVKDLRSADNTILVHVKVDEAIASRTAGIKLQARQSHKTAPPGPLPESNDDSIIICRCERVTLGEIRKAIRSGIRDLNQLKALTRAGMGACGGKTCQFQILSLYKAEGVKPEEITGETMRPLVMEVFLGQFSNAKKKDETDDKFKWSDF